MTTKRRHLVVNDKPSTTQTCITNRPPAGPTRMNSHNIHVKKNVLNCTDSRRLMDPLRRPTGVIDNSITEGHQLFAEIISPISTKMFFEEFWEKKPILVKRHTPRYNEPWFSLKELQRIVTEERLYYGENIDVVTYTNGVRETHNPAGRVHSSVLWDYYQNGCSVRLLNPQTYCDESWRRLSLLQEYLGSMAGANVYLTPANTQGFAPHWDDIEAFILQLEGKKHWKVYPNRTESEKLPRYSSKNFTEMDLGEPALDIVLEAGDLLYFPRGFIHQGRTLANEHSLHITFSCAQKHSWGDLMEKVLPNALQTAFAEDAEFRKSLPIDYLNYMGVAFSDQVFGGLVYPNQNLKKRDDFIKHIHLLTSRVIGYMALDPVCDQHSKSFIHDSLPPYLNESEIVRTSNNPSQGVAFVCNKLGLTTRVKLLRKNMIRLVMEEDSVFVFHSTENARLYHSRPLQSIEIDEDLAPAVEFLIANYPQYTSIDRFPCETSDQKFAIADILYENGILLTETPLGFQAPENTDTQSPTQVKKRNKSSTTLLRIEKSTSF